MISGEKQANTCKRYQGHGKENRYSSPAPANLIPEEVGNHAVDRSGAEGVPAGKTPAWPIGHIQRPRAMKQPLERVIQQRAASKQNNPGGEVSPFATESQNDGDDDSDNRDRMGRSWLENHIADCFAFWADVVI